MPLASAQCKRKPESFLFFRWKECYVWNVTAKCCVFGEKLSKSPLLHQGTHKEYVRFEILHDGAKSANRGIHLRTT
jgi:hypothetical protein